MFNISFNNILSLISDGSVQPGYLAIIGMTIVFIGLVFLMIMVNVLKFILEKAVTYFEKIRNKRTNLKVKNEVAIAIALALNFHMSKYWEDRDYIITLKKYTKSLTPWALDGRGRIHKVFHRSWR